MITADRVREVLRYDANTGVFTWLVSVGCVKVGDIAGSGDGDGYVAIMIDGRHYKAHRLAWLYVTGELPSLQIDHANGTRDDNRWANLREATQSQNLANSSRRSDNTSGFKGVGQRRGRWRAQIRKDGRRIHLGTFSTPEAAHAAYLKAANDHHGEFARAEAG